MIDPEFAVNFVKRMKKQLDVEMNIMNDKGVIIASTSRDRVGSFHQVAYDMITKRQPISIIEHLDTDCPLFGVLKPGINMLVMDGTEIAGVIGISGPPAENMKLISLAKYLLETLLQSQNQAASKQLANQDANVRLVNAMLFETPSNPARIYKLAKERGLKNGVLRIPLLMVIHKNSSNTLLEELITQYLQSETRDLQDILLKIDTSHLLLFRTTKQFQPEYLKEDTETLCGVLDSIMEKQSTDPAVTATYYYSTPCMELADYRHSYNCLHWLASHIGDKTHAIHAFSQHFFSYIMENTSQDMIRPIFDKYATIIKEQMDVSVFLDSVHALMAANMNVADAAELLFIHKNTLNARMKKIKALLGIDPFFNMNDSIFLIGLYHYLLRMTR